MNRSRSGFTIFELLTVIVLMGIIFAFAYPRISQISNGASLRAARGALITAVNVARSSAIVSGKCSFIKLSGNSITVFTSSCSGGTQITIVSSRNFVTDYGVATSLAKGAATAVNPDSVGFDPRGIPLNNTQTATFSVTRNSIARSVVIGTYGRIQ